MKKIITLIMAAVALIPTAHAKGIAPVGLDSISFGKHGDFMVLGMDMNLKPTDVESQRAEIITPLVVSAAGDTLELPSVGIYGRLRYINYQRNNSSSLSKDGMTAFKSAERPEMYPYNASIPYQDWMREAQLLVRRRLYGCANCLIDEKTDPIIRYFEPNPGIPQITYFEAKDLYTVIDTLNGSAFVDFVVDKTNVDPNYRRNPRELLKIRESIDTVLNDPDVTILGVTLKGFASPESPYAHNTDLAKGRTQAIKDYIMQFYDFKPGIIATGYEPEDWAGLRRDVARSNIDHKQEILDIIDSDMEPDPKEDLIKKRFPKEYKFMLDNFYPGLRHTEYSIIYQVKRFDDIAKIREVMRTKPNRLTLREFKLLGDTYAPGSDEFNEVYETAVRMYPNDPVANINAANAVLQRCDFATAEKYLQRAGDSDEAQFARGSLAYLTGNFDRAIEILSQLPNMQKAQDVIDEIAKIRQSSNSNQVISVMLE